MSAASPAAEPGGFSAQRAPAIAVYPLAEVLAAVAAICLIVTLIMLVAAATVLVRAETAVAEDFGDERNTSLLLLGLGTAATVFLLLFTSAWFTAGADGRHSPFDLLGVSLAVVVASGMFALVLTLGLVMTNSDRLAGVIAWVAAGAARAQGDALLGLAPPGVAATPAYPSVDALQRAVLPAGATQLGTTVWVTGRALLFLATAGTALVVSAFSLALRERSSALLPVWLQWCGTLALPLAGLQFLAVFGGSSFVLILPALAVTVLWLGTAVRVLLRRAELRLAGEG